MRTRRARAWIACVLLASVFPTALRADVLWLRDGRRIAVRARRDGEDFLVRLPGAEHRIPERSVSRLEASPTPAEVWASRRERALAGTADDREAAAWWAVQNGLPAEALALVAEAADRDAEAPGMARLRGVAAGLAATLADPDLDALAPLLPRAARFARGPHTLLIHQHEPDEATRKLALLERVLATFTLEQSARGVALTPPRRRLVFLWFRDRAEYQARLRGEGATGFLETHGYFHPTRLIVLQCDERAFDAPGPRGAGPLAALERDLARAHRDLGTAAHEWVHLLCRTTGLVPRHEDWPLWLHEGFAMQYEGAAAGEWSGPGTPSPERLADARGPARPVPLATLIDPSRAPTGYDRAFYAASWSWVYFLRTEHPGLWASLLHAGRSPADAGLRRPDGVKSRIEAGSGRSLADLERDWSRFVRALPAPGDPAP
jgi:hypothetical protein